MEMFEKLTKKDDSPMPKIWMDPEGKTRTYMFIDQKNETEKEHPDFNSVYTLTCPQAPDGKHIYSVKIKSVEYFEEAAVSNFKKYLVPTLIGITSAVATAAAGVFLKKYYFS